MSLNSTGKRLLSSQEAGLRVPVVLVVDDDAGVRSSIGLILKDTYKTFLAKDATEAVDFVRSRPVDMILLDIALPDIDGLKTIDMIRETDKEVGILMLTASDSARQAVLAMKKGAFDYITKPFDEQDLLMRLKRCEEELDLKSKVTYLKQELEDEFSVSEIISKSPKMKRVFDIIRRVSNTSSSVLILGESVTGKELVARAIHSMSDRKDKPFVPINCGAIPSELMESEMFGYEKGAFTGAGSRKIGRFEYADGGTVFLDEIATLNISLQTKLLRVIQEKQFERVGGLSPINLDIRIISATNIDLQEAIRAGSFREDLYWRLKVVPIMLPPLRERKEDVPLLAGHFLKLHSMRSGKRDLRITDAAMDALKRYNWPGNIRELENFIERLVVLSKDNGEISTEDLPVEMFYRTGGAEGEAGADAQDFKDACRVFERHYIIGVLNSARWNRTEAAKRLKMHRNTLLMKMKHLGIKEI
jgi:DNA-binding NtrC family response regulator